MNANSTTVCRVYRCSRQSEMYIYLRDDLKTDVLPEPLLQRTGALTEVMKLDLHPTRRLARVEVRAVIDALISRGFFLQMPPEGQINGHLDDGD